MSTAEWARHKISPAQADCWLLHGWTLAEAGCLLRLLGLVAWRDLGPAVDPRVEEWLVLRLGPDMTLLAVAAGLTPGEAGALRPGDRPALRALASLAA